MTLDELHPEHRAKWDAITAEYNHTIQNEPSSPERSDRLSALHQQRTDILHPEYAARREIALQRPANPHLSEQQFYHGTAAELRPGTHIKPAAQIGHPTNFTTYGNDSHAYATESIHTAHRYADLALNAAHDRNQGRGKARRIYQVTPLGNHEPDPDESSGRRSQDGWKVLRRVPAKEWNPR